MIMQRLIQSMCDRRYEKVCVSDWDLYWTVSVIYSTLDLYFHVSHSSQWLIRHNSQELISQTNEVFLQCKNPPSLHITPLSHKKSNETEKKKKKVDSFFYCYLNFFFFTDGAVEYIRLEFIITKQKYVPLCSLSLGVSLICHFKRYYHKKKHLKT